MARPSFSVSIAGSASRDDESPSPPVNSVVPRAKFCYETIIGDPRRKKPKGWIAPRPYTFERMRYDKAFGRITNLIGSQKPNPNYLINEGYVGGSPATGAAFSSEGHWDQAWTPPNRVPVEMTNRALIKARLSMKDTKVNLGVAFAERNRTASLVGNTAKSLALSALALRKGNWKKAAELLGLRNAKRPRGSSLPAKWLEYQYGWSPLLSDAFGAAHALAERELYDWMVTGKGRVSEPVRKSVKTGTYQSREWVDVDGMYGAFVRIDARPGNDVLSAFTSMGCTNPAEIAWELVPFSFVVDWFLPIGNWLSSLDAMLGFGPSWTSTSTLIRGKWKGTGVDDSGGSERVESNFSSRKEFISLNRSVLSDVPLPTMPSFKDPRSLAHLANGLSLLTQVFGGKR